MTQSFLIRGFRPADQRAVEALVLAIQRDEFDLALTAENQPDLKDVSDYFSNAGSAFWIAEDRQSKQIIGCIGLEALPDQIAVMRKFMVHPAWRGKAAGVASALNKAFERHAQHSGAAMIFLSTVEATKAAQRFYENAGYTSLTRDQFPPACVPGILDSVFYGKKVA
jgi:N-acetylglutamate synthase-like GNAT family acetyltransferase